jgi:isopentenyl diphosphate isomerase/L-lactate dehydrogenase-like FMN-dependent dehydrogenase
VGDRSTVLIDGGVRTGSDVVTALRPWRGRGDDRRPDVYGLAVAGGDGVSAVLEILASEMRQTLMGVAGVAELSRDRLISAK